MFFNEVGGIQLVISLRLRLLYRDFPVNFENILLIEHLSETPSDGCVLETRNRLIYRISMADKLIIVLASTIPSLKKFFGKM